MSSQVNTNFKKWRGVGERKSSTRQAGRSQDSLGLIAGRRRRDEEEARRDKKGKR